MHEALKRLLKALPPIFGGSIMVADEMLAQGDEAFTKCVRRSLANKLADFIVGSKLLDGADKSGYEMRPSDEFMATKCTVRAHVLTPMELEKIVINAFEEGRRSMDLPRPQFEQEWIERRIRELEGL